MLSAVKGYTNRAYIPCHIFAQPLVLKVEHSVSTVNPTSRLICCFDVSKQPLSPFAEYRTETPAGASVCRIEDEIPNRTGTIEPLLGRLAGLACEPGPDGLTVCAEATGGYERKLLGTVRRLGHQTTLISPEHVAKLKSVETSDTGKTDHKDRLQRPTTKTPA